MADNLPVSEADFTTIKENLKIYLKNQQQFQDFNFEGSAISVLLDILAYNTHMSASHANMVFAETFLDSAAIRGSVVSRSKELGYTPRSKSAAKANVTISFSVTGNPSQYILPKGTKFLSTSGATSFIFVLDHDVIIDNNNNTFSTTIDIYQGKFNTFTYTVNLNDASQRFIIPSLDADTNFLTVLFKENDSIPDTEYAPWQYSKNVAIGSLNSNSTVFFLQEDFDENFEVYFGDGVIGKALTNGNMIQLSYLITDGADANAAGSVASFTLNSTLTNTSNIHIITNTAAIGGADKESIESIKFLAPFYYAAQNRAVTEHDYIALIKSTYSQVEDVAIWGGEKNDPPYYGKVFIAIKPQTELVLTPAEKLSMQNDILARYSVMSIRPQIVDPEYINVSVDTTVLYNSKLFDPTGNINLSQIVTDAVSNFFTSQTNRFGQPLYYSNLQSAISNSSPLITSNILTLNLPKQLLYLPEFMVIIPLILTTLSTPAHWHRIH